MQFRDGRRVRRVRVFNRRFCGPKGGAPRTLGIWLMIIGVLALIVFIPFKVWLGIIGLLLIIAGVVLWRRF